MRKEASKAIQVSAGVSKLSANDGSNESECAKLLAELEPLGRRAHPDLKGPGTGDPGVGLKQAREPLILPPAMLRPRPAKPRDSQRRRSAAKSNNDGAPANAWPKPVDPSKALNNSLKWCGLNAPEISIVVVSHNNSGYILECIRQIWQGTTNIAYEIIIVDNGSHKDKLNLLQDIGRGIMLIELGTDRFFGEACNIGAESASAPYLCFIGNGTFPYDNCLRIMRTQFDFANRVGAVGPMFIVRDFNILRKHMLVDDTGFTRALEAISDEDAEVYLRTQRVDYVSASALMVRREDFLGVGGFDFAFEPAYYEDVDLCFKLRAAGLETWYCVGAQVARIGGGPAADAKTGGPTSRDVCRAKFVARWKGDPSRSQATIPLLDRPNETREPGAKAKTIALPGTGHARMVAILSPYPLTPGGGERFILTLAATLGAKDHVFLVTPHRYSHIRILNLGREFGVDVSEIRNLTYDQFVGGDWDLMIALGNEALPQFPAHADRSVYVCQFPFRMKRGIARLRRNNIEGYERVLAYSRYARLHTVRSLEKHKQLPVDILYPPCPLIGGNSGLKREIILSVGRFSSGGHEKRQDVLIRAFRRLRSEGRIGAEVELHLAGSSQPTNPAHMAYLSDLVGLADGLPVKFHLDATKETLFELYRDAALYWHAAGYGADLEKEPGRAEHFGIAIVEAMSAECVPVVFAAGGPTEIVTDGVDGFWFRTEDELVDLTARTMSVPFRPSRVEMGRAARIACARYSPERFAESAWAYLG